MAKPISSGTSQEKADKTIADLEQILASELGELDTLRSVVSTMANYAYAMGQQDLCFELQALLLAKPSPNKS